MRLLLFILFTVVISCPLSAQAVTKSGQNTTTGINFVNRNGEIENYQALSKNGQQLFPGSISTTAASSITINTAISGGNITTGGETIISRGVCWATAANPTTASSKTTDGSGSGSFTSNLTGLATGTTYYIRAYATTSVGTTYGNQVTFTTLKQLYETLSAAVYSEYPKEVNDITFGNAHFTKITQGAVNCGGGDSYLAKTIENAYSMTGTDSVIDFNLTNPVLQRFVEDGINCQVLDISDKYIYYGHSAAFYRIDKNTFGNKVKFQISGIWAGGTGNDVSSSAINGVNEMPDLGLLIQVDNSATHCNFYKVPFAAQETGNHTYTQTNAILAMTIPFRNSILSKAWNLSTKGNIVFAVIYNCIGQGYLSMDAGNSFKCVFSMADTSINSTTPADQMVFVDTKPDGNGGFGAIGGHPMKNTLTNPQDYDLWGVTPNGSLHSHGCYIDTYSDRLIIVTGDSYPAVGIFYSDDWGYNWTLVKTGTFMPSADSRTQFVTIIPMKDCILFGNDGVGDGYWRLFRNGTGLFSTIENCYQFTGSNTELVTINGGSCFTKDGTVLGLINPSESTDYTTTRGGIVATKNGHNFKKLYEDSFSNMTYASAEIGRRELISVNDNNKVLIKAKNGGLIILDMTQSASSK